MFDRRYNSSPLTAAILATLYPSLSLGQQGQQDSGKLETIIVTATRRELNLQEVGQSITAFSTADIERQALQDVEDVINALPSVNLVNSMPGRNSIFMRGISTGPPSTTSTARSPSTSTISRSRRSRSRSISGRSTSSGSSRSPVRREPCSGRARSRERSATSPTNPMPTVTPRSSTWRSARSRAERRPTTSAVISTSPSTTTSPCGWSGSTPTRAAGSTMSSART